MSQSDSQWTRASYQRGLCHYCQLAIEDGDKAVESNNTPGVYVHVTCWYDGGPFERDMRERAAG